MEPGFEALRVQRDYLNAYVEIREGRAAQGLAELPDIAARAETLGLLDISLEAVALHAQSLLRQNQFTGADRLLLNALERSTDAVAYQRGAILLNLGVSRLARNRFDEALTYFERVLTDRSIESTLVYRSALGNAGFCYSRLGDLERAEAVQRRAVEGHERIGSGPLLQQSMGQLGITLMLQGDSKQGIARFTRALEIATANKQTADAATWAGNLAIAYAELENWDDAERFNNLAIGLRTTIGSSRLTYHTYTRARIAAGRGRASEAITTYEGAIRQASDDPYIVWLSHAGMADVYRQSHDMQRAIVHYEEALGTIERTRADLLTPEYRLTFLSRLIDFHQRYVDALVANGDIERALEVAESSRARVLAERQRVARAARVPAAELVRMAARTKTVLLSYWLAPTRSFVWIITDKGIRCVTLPGSNAIAPLVRGYRDLVTVSLADPLAVESSPGTRLSDMVLTPVLDTIPPGTSVVVVPDGALHDVNFDMLIVPSPKPHYWIEDAIVTLAPSLALAALDTAPRTQADRALLLVGDPVNSDRSLPPLTYAGAELTGIERAFGRPAQILRGSQATPRAVSDSEPGRFSFIHFAAHATASAESPLDSAILLSPESSSTSGSMEGTASAVPAHDAPGTPKGVPYVREGAEPSSPVRGGAEPSSPRASKPSGLQASDPPRASKPSSLQASDPPQASGPKPQDASPRAQVPGPAPQDAGPTSLSSYKLYARDVAAFPLNADVVTLSACRSAGGRAYGGEGLVGFAWAFLRAGARQVVAGLWDVDDQSTALLMERYYQRLGAGATAAEALRDAKLSLLRSSGNFRKPYYWAAFAVFASAIDRS